MRQVELQSGKNEGMSRRFILSSSPHIQDTDSVTKIMYGVVLALVPAGVGAVLTFGFHALWLIGVSVVSAVLTEVGFQILQKRPVEIADGSAVVTGILLAYNVPPEVPWWIVVLGSAVSIGIGKMVFGGLGFNPMNPALIGRAFLTASWPAHMLVFRIPPRLGTLSGIDAITDATPLSVFKHCREIISHASSFSTDQVSEATEAIFQLYGSHGVLFFGRIGGCLGETSAFLLLIGAVYLMYKRIIGWKIPFSFIGTVALLAWIFGGTEGFFTGDILFHLLSGGLILGAFFMATDMVTSPITFWGRILFGAGCGVLTMIIRLWGGYPEGVCYSILLMNLFTPLLDKFTVPKKFGGP
jgi:electron transport complex protein RnfD